MAERKQVNRYYPPDFDPAKHKSINKYRNSHPLRERAKKLSQGILVIRFEMPYNIWCGGCGNHIGMGVRYNAEKKKVGKYYTTPIYRFRMKCHLCDNYIEMETDPKNFDYTIVSGAQRKNQKWDMAENEQVLTEDREAVKKLQRDAMYKLEHGVDDSKKLKKAAPSLSQIAEIQSAKREDYNQNQMLRKKFREEKKKLLAEEAGDKALLAKSSLDMELVPETEEDKKLASLLKFSTTQSYEETRQQKRFEIQNQDIFDVASTSSPSLSIELTPSSSSSSSSSSTKSSAVNRHLEAQKTLMTAVLKKKGSGLFGAFDAKASPSLNSTSSSSSAARSTRLLIGGTTGLVVTKKKRRSDSTEGQEKKRMRRSMETRDDNVFEGKMTDIAHHSDSITSEKSRTCYEEGDHEPSTSYSSAASTIPAPSPSTTLAALSEPLVSPQSTDHGAICSEASINRTSPHRPVQDSQELSKISSSLEDSDIVCNVLSSRIDSNQPASIGKENYPDVGSHQKQISSEKETDTCRYKNKSEREKDKTEESLERGKDRKEGKDANISASDLDKKTDRNEDILEKETDLLCNLSRQPEGICSRETIGANCEQDLEVKCEHASEEKQDQSLEEKYEQGLEAKCEQNSLSLISCYSSSSESDGD